MGVVQQGGGGAPLTPMYLDKFLIVLLATFTTGLIFVRGLKQGVTTLCVMVCLSYVHPTLVARQWLSGPLGLTTAMSIAAHYRVTYANGCPHGHHLHMHGNRLGCMHMTYYTCVPHQTYKRGM